MWQQNPRQPFPQMDPTPDWLQAGYYQNIPHGEVNWAHLAQQWMAMRQIQEQEFIQRQFLQQQQQQLQEIYNRPLLPFPTVGQTHPIAESPDLSLLASAGITVPHQFQAMHSPLYGRHPTSGIGDAHVLFPSGQPAADKRFVQGTPPMRQPVGSGSMGHGSFPQQRHPLTPSLLTSDFQPPSGFAPPPPPASSSPAMPQQDVDFRTMWPSQAQQPEASTSAESSMIDVQMRKQLPAWIREGLEKVEREKRKQQQAEEEAASAASSNTGERIPKWRLEETEGTSGSEQAADDVEEKDDGNSFEDESAARDERDLDGADQQDPEEFKEQLLVKLRFWMTSILLDVTSSEISNVVRTFFNASRAPGRRTFSDKAQPKVLVQSSALASILGFSDEDERDDTASDAEGNEEPKKDEENFKVPMLPLSTPSVCKKIPDANDGKVNVAVDARKSIEGSGEIVPVAKPASSRVKESDRGESKRSSRDSDRGESESSSHRHREKSKDDHRRRRSRSPKRRRSRSRSAERKSHRRDHRHRSRSRSRSPSRNGDKSDKSRKSSRRSKSKSPSRRSSEKSKSRKLGLK